MIFVREQSFAGLLFFLIFRLYFVDVHCCCPAHVRCVLTIDGIASYSCDYFLVRADRSLQRMMRDGDPPCQPLNLLARR